MIELTGHRLIQHQILNPDYNNQLMNSQMMQLMETEVTTNKNRINSLQSTSKEEIQEPSDN
jgi:hypothetical protein